MRGRPLGEADRVVTFFTVECGKVDAVAKGVRRARSHLAGRLEFGNECLLGMHRGRSLDVVVSAEIARSSWLQLVEPEHYAVASVVAELVDAFCEPDLAMPEIYALLVDALSAIAASNAPALLLPRFSLLLLDMLGLAPPLDRCVRCGHMLSEGVVWLDAENGGFVDAACRECWREAAELQPADIANLRALAARKDSSTPRTLRATAAAANAVAELVSHHLGRRPKSLAQIGSIR